MTSLTDQQAADLEAKQTVTDVDIQALERRMIWIVFWIAAVITLTILVLLETPMTAIVIILGIVAVTATVLGFIEAAAKRHKAEAKHKERRST